MTELLAPPLAKGEIDQLLERHGLGGAAAAVAFFSFESPQSFIAARDPDGSITPLIGFFPLPVRGRELIDAIASIDENGPRLIANYEHAFPELMAGIRAFGTELEPVESESLGWLLAASSLLVGLQDEDVARALGPVPSLVNVDTVVGGAQRPLSPRREAATAQRDELPHRRRAEPRPGALGVRVVG